MDRATVSLRQDRLHQALDACADVVFEQDAEGRWVSLNAAWHTILAHDVAASLGQDFADYLHPEDVSAAKARRAALTEGAVDPQPRDLRYVTRHGTYVVMEERLRLASDGQGRRVGYVGTLRDVTAHRELVSELSRCHERTVRSHEGLTGFLANISHEIRTPLNGILGITAILLDASLTPDQREMVATAHKSSETLIRLVEGLLDISTLEADGLVLVPKPVEIRPWLDESVSTAFARARDKGLDAHASVGAAVPGVVVADAPRVRQALEALLDNAVKFTARGSVSVFVDVTRAGGREVLQVSVSDTGIGIPPDHLSTVFEKYRQLDGTLTRQYGGTGLGLTIARQLAVLMGGDIDVESELGRGSRFSVSLPLVRQVDAPRNDPGGPDSAPARRVPGVSPSVLVVEDEPTNQLVARRFLERQGCIVTLAKNGEEGLAAAQGRHFDAIFMDCQMPLMDGYDASRRIRSGSLCADVPIVAMTAHAMAGDREKCLAAGMTDYMTKPLAAGRLAQVIRGLFGPPAHRTS